MRSAIELKDVAEQHLALYCSPASKYAWPHYDRDPVPGELTAIDLLAPALLSHPIKALYLQKMLRRQPSPDAYERLRAAIESVIADRDATTLAFERLDSNRLGNESEQGWGTVVTAMRAAQECPGLTSVAVSKILHRKRPDLVPIVDSRLRSFYGAEGKSYVSLFERIHGDINMHHAALDRWREPYFADGRPMSRLRTLDIVIWMDSEPT